MTWKRNGKGVQGRSPGECANRNTDASPAGTTGECAGLPRSPSVYLLAIEKHIGTMVSTSLAKIACNHGQLSDRGLFYSSPSTSPKTLPLAKNINWFSSR